MTGERGCREHKVCCSLKLTGTPPCCRELAASALPRSHLVLAQVDMVSARVELDIQPVLLCPLLDLYISTPGRCRLILLRESGGSRRALAAPLCEPQHMCKQPQELCAQTQTKPTPLCREQRDSMPGAMTCRNVAYLGTGTSWGSGRSCLSSVQAQQSQQS